jgi:RHS repeat-associated protein
MIEHNVHTYGDESDKTVIGEYEYDDFGNRTYKKSKDEETYYMNNGLNVLNEITSTGTMSKLMVAGVGELSFDGTFKYIHTDVQGTARLVTNELGEVVAEYKYEPFGELAGVNEQVQGGEIAPLNHKDMSVADGEMHLGYDTEETDYLYTGQEFDDESGLMYYNARYYNPVVGRFISRDSYMGEIGDTLSRSRYAYVKNNPYRYVDPTGNVALKQGVEQLVNATNLIGGSREIVGGGIKNIWGRVSRNEELIGASEQVIIDGYNKVNDSVNEMQDDWNEYVEKSWAERLNDDLQFAEDVVEELAASAVEPLDWAMEVFNGESYVMDTAPAVYYYNEPSVIHGSIIDDLKDEEYDELVSIAAGLVEVGTIAVGAYTITKNAVKFGFKQVVKGGDEVSSAISATSKLVNGSTKSTKEILDLAEDFLGPNYKELVPGSGRYVSADGTRVVRMGDTDITGKHDGGPHVNFETLLPNPSKPGKMTVSENIHIYIKD